MTILFEKIRKYAEIKNVNVKAMLTSIDLKKALTNELLFVLYFCMFSFLKPIVVSVGGASKIILLVFALMIISVHLIHNKFRFEIKRFICFSVFLMCIILSFAIDLIFRNNTVLYQNMYYFCIYGIVPMFLLINVKHYKKLLWLWCTLTFSAGFLFLLDPFFGYHFSGGYMPFGHNHMLPAFVSSIVLFLYYRKRWTIIPAIIFFAELLMYANKGSVLTAGIFLVLFWLFLRRLEKKKIWYVVLILAGVIVILYLLRFVLVDLVYDFAKLLGVESYSLKTFREMLYVSPDRIFALRTDIWKSCLEKLKNSWLFGIGIGSFQATYGGYPHNVFLDIFVSSGIIPFLLFVVGLIKSLFDFKKYKKEKKIFMFVMLMLWLFPLQISLTFWRYAPFWIYWSVWFMSARIIPKGIFRKAFCFVEGL